MLWLLGLKLLQVLAQVIGQLLRLVKVTLAAEKVSESDGAVVQSSKQEPCSHLDELLDIVLQVACQYVTRLHFLEEITDKAVL